MRLSTVTILLLLTAAALPSRADATPEQFRAEARLCRDRSSEATQLYENLVGRVAYHAAYMRQDLLLAKLAYQAATEAWRDAADAFDEQDSATAATRRAAAEATGRACSIWHERFEIREKQALAAPSEGNYCQLRFNTGPLGNQALAALIEARKDASEAWGSLADAMVPGADREKLAALSEKAQQAAGEVELATAAYTAADRREKLARDGGSLSPQAASALDALKKLDAERAALKRDEIALAARLRDLDRKRSLLEEQVRQAYEDGRKSGAPKP